MIAARVWAGKLLGRWAERLQQRLLAWAGRAGRVKLWARRDLNRLSTLAHARLKTCSVCPHFNARLPDRCGQCGCYMPAKVQFEKARCPIGKW